MYVYLISLFREVARSAITYVAYVVAIAYMLVGECVGAIAYILVGEWTKYWRWVYYWIDQTMCNPVSDQRSWDIRGADDASRCTGRGRVMVGFDMVRPADSNFTYVSSD